MLSFTLHDIYANEHLSRNSILTLSFFFWKKFTIFSKNYGNKVKEIMLKLAAHLFRWDRNRRVRSEYKCLRELGYMLFYLTAHTFQIRPEPTRQIRSEPKQNFWKIFFLTVRRGCACTEGSFGAVAGMAQVFTVHCVHYYSVC